MVQLPATSALLARRALPLATMSLACAALVFVSSRAQAHGISESAHETVTHGGVVDFIWLGAEHMVTGYDHLLFLFGVIFFLDGFRDVVRFITAFTLGHCITLLGATLAGITANAYLIDAVIALSVIYKGFENLDGFKKYLNIRAPNLLVMVFLFGLIHGFGLSTRLQELTLAGEGLVSRILAFNVGVEVGQVAALTVMLAFFRIWRSTQAFQRFDTVANSGLVLAGVGLFIMQMNSYAHEHEEEHHGSHTTEEAAHDDGHPIEAVDEASHGHEHGDEAAPEPHGHDHGEEAAPEPHGHDHGEEAAPEPHGHDHGEEAKEAAPEPHGHDHGEEAEEAGSGHGHGHGHEHGHGHSHGGDDGTE